MRNRQLIIGVIVVSGILAAVGGFLGAWENDDMFVGRVGMIMGVGLVAAATIYALAMDDPEARATALATRRGQTIDLRDPVSAPAAETSDTSTRVSV